MSKGFFSHIADGFAHIYTDKGDLVKVSAHRLPETAKPGADIDVRTSPKGHVRVGAVGNSTKLNTAQDRQQYAIKRLMLPGHGPSGKGWSPAQASGMVGRFMQESFADLRTDARGDLSIPGASVGIGQWNRYRKAAMIAYTTGKNPGGQFADHPLVKAALAASPGDRGVTNFDAQLDFADWEMRNSPSENLAFSSLARANSPDEAAAAMMHYERPKGYRPGDPTAGHGFRNSAKNASGVLTAYDPSYVPDIQVGGGAAGAGSDNPDGGDNNILNNNDPMEIDPDKQPPDEQTAGEPTLGETISQAFEGGKTDYSGTQAIGENIAGMIQQGQQAGAGALPRLPTIEELYKGAG